MTREEAIEHFKEQLDIFGGEHAEAIKVAIEALNREQPDEWCDDCKEYDTEKKCCPRFNKVIREALKREPSEDGTLEVKVEDATKVGRVLISDDKHRGGLYYPDEDEPQSVSFENDTEIKSYSKDSDLISRAEAINAIVTYGYTDIASSVHVISNLPSADRPTDGDLISRADAIRVVEKNSYRMAGLTEVKLKCEMEALPSADRPRGEWVSKEELIDAINDAEFVYDGDDDGHKEHDISELVRVMFKDIIDNLPSADMRGEDE